MRKAGVYVYEIMEPTHANTELLAYLPLLDGQSINESSEKKNMTHPSIYTLIFNTCCLLVLQKMHPLLEASVLDYNVQT